MTYDKEFKLFVQCQGKTPYDSRAEAKEMLASARRRIKDTTMSIYKCPFCHKWHLGRDGKR
jgi:hypothetical protein